MKTPVFQDIKISAEILNNGGLVAVPTETVYGLAANALDEKAVAKIFEVKGRPENMPLSVMVSGEGAFGLYCKSVPPQAKTLADKFWPGPLTIVLKAQDCFPGNVLAGGDTVGLRCPKHDQTLALLKEVKLPLAAPSANPSGLPSPTSAQQVADYFDGEIDAIIDGGECEVGTASTIIDLSQSPYKILREGAVSKEQIQACLISAITIVGVTGSSGSGKSIVLDELTLHGAAIIDCDKVYHELTISSAEMREEIMQSFGDVYDGNLLNRKKLGSIVFADANALLRLNKITHKYVHEEVRRILSQAAMQGKPLAAIEAIALIDSPSGDFCTFKVGVTAPKETRIKRLISRENITGEYALTRIEAQHADEYFKKNCDYILSNDAGIDAFRIKCKNFFKEVLK